MANEYPLSIEVLTRYGNGELACVRCGERVLTSLVLDHTECRSSQLYRRVPRWIKGGLDLYCWLKSNKFPVGYQTLCKSCNKKKG